MKKTQAQIEESKRCIAEAKRTIEEMRAFFRSLGADLDSGENIFLNSRGLSPEGRQEAMQIIQKFENEYEERYQEYLENTREMPGEKRPATFRQLMEENQRAYREARDRNAPPRRAVKRIRL